MITTAKIARKKIEQALKAAGEESGYEVQAQGDDGDWMTVDVSDIRSAGKYRVIDAEGDPVAEIQVREVKESTQAAGGDYMSSPMRELSRAMSANTEQSALMLQSATRRIDKLEEQLDDAREALENANIELAEVQAGRSGIESDIVELVKEAMTLFAAKKDAKDFAGALTGILAKLSPDARTEVTGALLSSGIVSMGSPPKDNVQ